MHSFKYSLYPEFGLLVNERNGTASRLGGYELKLLMKLMENPGKVFTRDFLLAVIWQPKIVTQGCLSKTVHSLRFAIGDERPWSIIKTYHRQGVSMSAEIVSCINIVNSRTLPAPAHRAMFESCTAKH